MSNKNKRSRGSGSQAPNACGSGQQPASRNTNNNNRARRQDEKFRREGESVAELGADLYRAKTMNDPRWYGQSEQMLKDYASFPFGVPLGSRLNTGAESIDAAAVPGIMAFDLVPSVGVAISEVSPVNIAMRNFFSQVRKANSGRVNYEAPNLMMYLIAVSSAHAFLEFIKRAYGTMMLYYAQNRYLPKALLRAMHLSFDSLQANLADFRGYINQYAMRLNQLVIPGNVPYLARQSWVYKNIYTDTQTGKPQLYMYVPAGFFRYVEGTATSADFFLQYAPIFEPKLGPTELTFEQIIAYGNSLIEPLVASMDFAIMAGDIMKAFDGALHYPSGVKEDYVVVPAYEQEVLSQMENLTMVGYPPMANDVANIQSAYVIVENKDINAGYLQSLPMGRIPTEWEEFFPTGAAAAVPFDMVESRRIITFHKANPTPSDVMVATRLTATTNSGANAENVQKIGSDYYVLLDNVGSEWCAAAHVYYFAQLDAGDPDSWGIARTQAFYTMDAIGVKLVLNGVLKPLQNFPLPDTPAPDPQIALQPVNATWTQVNEYVQKLGLLSQFDWHPLIYPSFILSHNLTLAGMFLVKGNATDTVTGSREGTPTNYSGVKVIKANAIFGDIDNYTVIDPVDLGQMAEAALLSEFSVAKLQDYS